MMVLLPLLSLATLSAKADFDTKAIDQKVSALLRQMTLREKIGQLVQFSNGQATGPDNVHVDQKQLIAQGGMGSILNAIGAKNTNSLQQIAVEKSRLKVPLLFGLDVIHGYKTIFPVPLGMSASWDTDLVQRSARVAAVEATSEGIRWTFSPMVDIARDCRWGRIMEGAGEDPHLGSDIAAAYIRGYQGKSLSDPTSMVACAKHYVAYGGVEAGREYNAVDISERVLRDVYLPPFQSAVDAGSGTLMSAFNTIQGVPASADHHTLTDILRGEWKFKGFVVSDWGSVGELIEHGIALDNAEAAYKGLTAGVDMDMSSNAYASELEKLVKNGKLKASVIDQAATRILRIKFALGLMDHPLTDEGRAAKTLLAPEHLVVAREAAEKSFVLLKNQSVLPLQSGQKVALIGPLADSQSDMLGEWACQGKPEDVVTLRTSMAERLGDDLFYAKGADIQSQSEDGFTAAIAAARKADVVVMALGESRFMSGESFSRTKIDLPGNQQDLLRIILATGKPVVLVVFSGRPLALPWEAEHVNAMLEAWFPGVQAGPALTRTLFGDVAPYGRLTASFPRSVGQLPLYYNALTTGRPGKTDAPNQRFLSTYLDERTSPLFPFGYGLTYTKFTYSEPTILTKTAKASALNKGQATIEVEATVTNAGDRAGSDVAQVYIQERGTSVARPIRELKGYQRVQLAPGESKKVKFTLTGKDLAFWNLDMKHVAEPCELRVWVSPNSRAGAPATMRIEP
ncbi:MAG: beta-glucosidase [Armatimonadetes bacterium]|nr:beta-glucosidase [Armatimonadota bacterium]